MMSNKKKRGRRPLYETPEELQAAIDRYFDSCRGKLLFDSRGCPVTYRDGTQKSDGRPPTISGLSHALGFYGRETFTRQRKRSAAFNDVVLEARLRIEEFWEMALYHEESYRGARFILTMCFGWRKRGGEPDPLQDGVPLVQIVNRSAAGPRQKPGERIAAHALNINLQN